MKHEQMWQTKQDYWRSKSKTVPKNTTVGKIDLGNIRKNAQK